MRRSLLHPLRIRLAVFGFCAGLAGAALAGPHEDATTAYKQGDYITALRIWRPLADRGDAPAQTALGRHFNFGHGVLLDHVEAMRWYTLAAAQGDAEAQRLIGVMHYNGWGVPRSPAIARDWWLRAATNGSAYAKVALAIGHANGWLMPQDKVQALMWYILAAEDGDPAIIDGRDKTAAGMTSADIAAARHLAREWKLSR